MTLAATGFERLVVRKRREDHVDPCDQSGRRIGNGCAPNCKRFGLLERAVVDQQFVAGVQETLCNRRAHVAETDQADGQTRVV